MICSGATLWTWVVGLTRIQLRLRCCCWVDHPVITTLGSRVRCVFQVVSVNKIEETSDGRRRHTTSSHLPATDCSRRDWISWVFTTLCLFRWRIQRLACSCSLSGRSAALDRPMTSTVKEFCIDILPNVSDDASARVWRWFCCSIRALSANNS